MGLFSSKKKYVKNVTRDNEFLKNYAVKVNALMIYAEDNDKITAQLEELQNEFQYTVATADTDAKKFEKQIDNQYKTLYAVMSQPGWDEDEVIGMIRQMRATIITLMAER